MQFSSDRSRDVGRDLRTKLEVDGGPIVFLGCTNAMPFAYALELRSLGYPVVCVVDSDRNTPLHRPETHFAEISYPYPDWIVEVRLKTTFEIPFRRGHYSRIIHELVGANLGAAPQAFILNGFWVTLAPLLSSSGAAVLGLSHGADLDSWADVESAGTLADALGRSTRFRFLPGPLKSSLVRQAVKRQFAGFAACDQVIYFPKGISESGDRVLEKLERLGVRRVERFDVSPKPVADRRDRTAIVDGRLNLVSTMRFSFQSFPGGNKSFSKGNDVMLRGIAMYARENPQTRVHLVRKGMDLPAAEVLVRDLGLTEHVVWHDEMDVEEMLDLYQDSDICFDQVGESWLGAVGGYALYMGKPLIASVQNLVDSGIWPAEHPVDEARTEEQIAEAISRLSSQPTRERDVEARISFAYEHLSPSKVLRTVFDF